ncbi:hypothetical protein BDW74DRAFT_157272 [Aspergillus multicolor]|uniref:uncharacterized protein n=1 Tax=Aspergillus multicolor TaxID=41759 RepID=UPI003CCD0098
MPPAHRRPVSPLTLETCAPLDLDPDDCWLPGSDDELDKGELSAQRQRVEKLGEAYLKGTPLFILSASLRGPLDKGWVNPWKKDRRNGNYPTEQRVIPETNSLKRRQHQSAPAVPRSKSSATPRALSHADSPRKDSSRVAPKDRPPRLERPAAGHQSPRFTQPKSTDTRWLKKDKVSTRFQNIDPPTSPTTSISSRQQKRGAITESPSTSRPGTAVYGSPRSSKCQQAKPSEYQVSSLRHETKRGFAPPNGHTPGSNLQKDSSQSVNGGGSIHVVSSSSQLPQFEYRLKQRRKSNANAESHFSPKQADDKPGEAGPENLPQNPPSTRSPDPAESIIGQNTENLLTLTSASNIIEDPSTTNVDQAQASHTKTGTTSEINLPSAQPLPDNPPPPDNLTSLYSIAISKATSNRTDDHNADLQFSTQTALMMAQRSFQNDLRSPEDSPMASTRKRRASQSSDHQSPNAINITPFHKVNAPERDIVDGSDAPESGGAPMISTQYMIDTATPFTFSTEKKAGFRTLSTGNDKSKTKKRKTTSFALESPSEIPLDHYTSDEDDADNTIRDYPTEAPDLPSGSYRSAFPMTLTGTTPPTAQEGQGAESFDLSQAIAEAGSWLQQSFEINKDITHCRTAALPQPRSADPTH